MADVIVIPAQAGIACHKRALDNAETPAFAGVTGDCE